jgi:hypothetical protein
VFVNDGTADFAREDYPASSAPVALRAADVDGDSDLDVLVANIEADELAVLENEGGRFAAPLTVPLEAAPSAIATGDLDGDGDIDAVAACFSDDVVKVVLNQRGELVSAATHAVGEGPINIALGDADGDGDLDVLAANFLGDSVSLLENRGGGAFEPFIEIPVGSRPCAVVAADLDGDRIIDILSANLESNDVSVIRSRSLLRTARSFPVGGDGPVHGVGADLDGDGDADIVTVNIRSADVSVLLNETPPPSKDDKDGDGIPDECEPDCNANDTPDDLDVASGTSPDCNQNEIPDECELGAGDCDGSGVPDDCELEGRDCDGNGVLDSCDVAGDAPDENGNERPDACDPLVVVTLGEVPAEIVFEDGERALAFAGSLTSTNHVAPLEWTAASFANITASSAAAVVDRARMFLDTNANGRLDRFDTEVAAAGFGGEGGNRVEPSFRVLLEAGEPTPFLLVLDRAEVAEGEGPAPSSGGLVPGEDGRNWKGPERNGAVAFTSRLLAALAALALPALLAAAARHGRRPRLAPTAAAALVLATLLAAGLAGSGCSGDDDDRDDPDPPPLIVSELQTRLTGLGFDAEAEPVVQGLPATAWVFEL